MSHICNNCGEKANLIFIEEEVESHSYDSRGYSYTTSTQEVEVTECCEHWEFIDDDDDE